MKRGKNSCKHFANPFENNIFATEMKGKQDIPLPFLFDTNQI